MNKLLHSVPGQYDVMFQKNEDGTYTVTYGEESRSFHSSVKAYDSYVACIHHQMSCAGLFI
jgi:hypothetical protein